MEVYVKKKIQTKRKLLFLFQLFKDGKIFLDFKYRKKIKLININSNIFFVTEISVEKTLNKR